MFLEFKNENNKTALVAIKSIIFIEEFEPHSKNKILVNAITRIKIRTAISGDIFQDRMYITDYGYMYSVESVETIKKRLQ